MMVSRRRTRFSCSSPKAPHPENEDDCRVFESSRSSAASKAKEGYDQMSIRKPADLRQADVTPK